MKKTVLAMTMAAATAFTAAAPYAVAAVEADTALVSAAESSNAAETEENWQKKMQLGIKREAALMKEAGKTIDEWDKEVKARKEEGKAFPLDSEKIFEADPDTEIMEENGQVYFIGKSKAFGPVNDAIDAYSLVYSLVGMLGEKDGIDLALWHEMKAGDSTVYSFQQLHDGVEVMGSTVKINTDGEGNVTAVFASLDPGSVGNEKSLSRTDAEEVVKAKLAKSGDRGNLLPDFTERVILETYDMAEALNLDVEVDPIPSVLSWIVYSENKAGGYEGKKYPYIAHYVRADGTYIKSLPVSEPGDEESRNGFRKQKLFDGMEPDEWTGEITDINGDTKEVTLPVMFSETENKWYLGDIERKIVVADFAEAAYGDEHRLDIVSCETNDGWDNEDLFMYYNYIRSWDFYKDLGWDGPDGEGTDVVILKGLCYSDGTPYENACSIGKVENYQMFGYAPYAADGTALGLVKGLDVMAHEYTHTFTGTVMNDNLYENDLGAINEAMSDIMGNLVEYIYGDTDDKSWVLGENTGQMVRSMSRPSDMMQPEYVWDVFYGPHTENPVTANDRGGVHFNSSLLNKIASKLCLKYGMSYEEAVKFWIMAAAGMTPKTDYVRIPALLDWALFESGNEKYYDALHDLISEVKIQETEVPEKLPEGQSVIKLRLPETEAFEDKNWILFGFQLNTKPLGHLKDAAFETIGAMFEDTEGYEKYRPILENLIRNLDLDENRFNLDDMDSDDKVADIIADIVTESAGRILIQNTTWEENGTKEMVMVTNDLPTFYMLMNVSDTGENINNLVVLLGDYWFDLGAMDKTEDGEDSGFMEGLDFASKIAGNVIDRIFADEEETPGAETGSVIYLPANGLDKIKPEAAA